jgi:hypothetical protein
MTKIYQYEPLQNRESEVRILKILPYGESHEVHCSLEKQSLNDKPFYVAASYEWGEPEPQVDIGIDGKPFRIRHNLWLFLHYLQNNKPDLVRSAYFRLWVDAICIDQSNLIEKNAQVQIMSRIFTQADSVFAWLGWTTHLNTKTTFQFIREASFHGQSSPKTEEEVCQWNEKYVHSKAGALRFRQIPLVDVWREVLQISKLTFWSRRWIIQEILLAREVTVLLDGQELPWTALELLFRILRQPQFGNKQNGSREILWQLRDTIPFKIWLHRAKLRSSVSGRLASLSLLLKDFRPTICTVAHDKVYALLSMMTDAEYVQVDYTCPMIEVFSRVVCPGENGHLNFDDALILAKELGLPSQPKEMQKKTGAGLGPFLKYSGKVAALVRVIDVDLDWDVLFKSVHNGHYENSDRIRGVHDLQHLMKSRQELAFDLEFINSRVEHSLGQNASLINITKLYVREHKGKDGKKTSASTNASRDSRNWTYVVCDDGKVGQSRCSTLPGDFLWKITQQTSLVLRYHEGVFKIVGPAWTSFVHEDAVYIGCKEMSKTGARPEREKLMLFSKQYLALTMNLKEGSFDHRWVIPTTPTAKSSEELVDDEIICTTYEGELVRQFVENSLEDNSKMQKVQAQGEAVSSTSKVELTSNIEIIFDAWELLNFVLEFRWLG